LAKKFFVKGKKMSYEPKKSPELKILDPLWTSSRGHNLSGNLYGIYR
jgi:hypothetical protein